MGDAKEVPGSYGPPLIGLVYHTGAFLSNWHAYFAGRRKRLGSNVFKSNFGMKAIAMLDWQSLATVFDGAKVRKEYGFGPAIPTRQLVGDEVPTAFTNDDEHQRQKRFCLELLTRKAATIPAAFDPLLGEYLARWERLGSFEWDAEIEAFWSDFLFQWMLGVRPRRGQVREWVFNIFSSRAMAHPWSGFTRSLRAFQELLELVKSSPRFAEITALAESAAGLNEDRTAKQLLFYLGFNAWGGLQGLAKSALGELSLHPAARASIAAAAPPIGELQNAPPVERAVYEVLRLHPPVFFVYGVLKQDAMIESSTGVYRVRQGERLVGNLWFAQRDVSVFDGPDEFRPERFQDSSRLKYLVWANGYGDDDASPQNKLCAGRETVYLLMGKLLRGLCAGCRWELSAAPYWSKRKFVVAGMPANPLRVERFERAADA
jgi:cytochrome P450